MKNTSALLLAILFLSTAGCTNNPVKTSFPDVPTKLMVAPSELQTIQSDSLTTISIDDVSASEEKLSAFVKIVTANYTLANRLREQLIDLQLWITTQKSLNP